MRYVSAFILTGKIWVRRVTERDVSGDLLTYGLLQLAFYRHGWRAVLWGRTRPPILCLFLGFQDLCFGVIIPVLAPCCSG